MTTFTPSPIELITPSISKENMLIALVFLNHWADPLIIYVPTVLTKTELCTKSDIPLRRLRLSEWCLCLLVWWESLNAVVLSVGGSPDHSIIHLVIGVARTDRIPSFTPVNYKGNSSVFQITRGKSKLEGLWIDTLFSITINKCTCDNC